MVELFPSLISADLLNLRAEIENLDPHCDGYHVDVMDNHFVPNLTWGSDFVNAIADATAKPIWVQLMVDDPTDWIDKMTLNAHSCVSIHIESKGQTRRNLTRIREKNLKSSIAVNPQTPIETIFPYLDIVDVVLVMSVEPGFSGQAFIPEVVEKLKPLQAYRQTQGLKFLIGMDGGINKNNIKGLVQQGVEWFGIASAIFGQPNRVKAIKELQGLAGD